MKICEKCGKEILDEAVGCDCSVKVTTDTIYSSQSNMEFLDLIKNSKKTNIIAIALLVLGVISVVFINGWLGAVLCFIAEIIALIPNTKVQKLFKSKHPELDKKAFKNEQKTMQNELKSKNKDFKFSFVLGSIALVLLVLSLILPSPLFSGSQSASGDNSSDNSSIQEHKGFVGTWEHSRTTNSDTGKEVTPEEPFLEEMEIGEWNKVTLTYCDNQEILNCDGVWTQNEYTDKQINVTVTKTNGKTELHAKTYSLTYHEEQDCIGIVDGNLIHIYSRVGESPSSTTTQSSTSSNNSASHAKEPIVGSFDYSESRDADTMTSVTISKPYISHINFEADGTGNLTLKTETSTGFSLYTTTWEFVESADTARKYAVHTNTNETIYIFYYEDLDTCSTFGTLNGRTVMNVFKRYSGNAQDNVSGATTSEAYDIIGSYCFSYAYNPNTEYKTTNPSTPYTFYLTFCEGNSCLVQVKTNTSSNAYGLEFYNGKWSYEKLDGEFLSYKIVLDEGVTMAVLYSPEYDMCIVSNNSGILYYLERVED